MAGPVVLGVRGLAGPEPTGPVQGRPALGASRHQGGSVGRLQRPGECLGFPAGVLLVQRDVRRCERVARVDLLEHVGVGGVDRGDVDDARFPGEDVRKQRVAEPHHLVGEGQHSSADPLAHRVVEGTDPQAGREAYPLQQVDDPRATSHREDAGEVARRLREGVPAGGNRVPQPVRCAGRRTGGAEWQSFDEQLGEVGVAVGSPVDVRDEVVRGRRPRQGRHLYLGLLGREASNDQVANGGVATQVGQPRVQRVTLGPLLGANEEHETETLGVQPSDEVGEHISGGDVRPLQVVDDPQGRADPVQLVDELVRRLQHSSDGHRVGLRGRPDHQLQQLAARRRGPVVHPGAQPAPHGRRQRRVRHFGGAEVDAGAPQQLEPAGGRRLGGLAGQPGLADAGLALEDHHARPPLGDVVEEPNEYVHLDVTADQRHGRRGALLHDVQCCAGDTVTRANSPTGRPAESPALPRADQRHDLGDEPLHLLGVVVERVQDNELGPCVHDPLQLSRASAAALP